MRGIKFIVLVIGLSLITAWSGGSPVLAAPCYGTTLPDKGKVFLGFETYNVFKRKLEQDFGRVRSLQSFFSLCYGLNQRVSIDLKAGLGYAKQHPSGSDELDYPASFCGGYGFRVKIYDNRERGVKSVLGFQHISVHPRTIKVDGVKHVAVLDDWQISWLLSKQLAGFTPYLGVKLSRLDYIHWVDDERKRRMSDLTKSVGGVFGLDLPLDKVTRMNFEFHCFDEKALAVSLLREF